MIFGIHITCNNCCVVQCKMYCIRGRADSELYSNKCETMAQKSCLLSSLTIVQVSYNCEDLGSRSEPEHHTRLCSIFPQSDDVTLSFPPHLFLLLDKLNILTELVATVTSNFDWENPFKLKYPKLYIRKRRLKF